MKIFAESELSQPLQVRLANRRLLALCRWMGYTYKTEDRCRRRLHFSHDEQNLVTLQGGFTG